MTYFEKNFITFSVLFILSLILLSIPLIVSAQNSPTKVQSLHHVAYNSLQEVWIDKLGWCESHNNPYAINPKDLDGTASLGTFQFKVRTYQWLLKKYNIPVAPIFASSTQREIVRHMINDPSIKIRQQFPDCVRRIGLPPTSDSS